MGVTPLITTGMTRVQLKTRIESRATLMDALAGKYLELFLVENQDQCLQIISALT